MNSIINFGTLSDEDNADASKNWFLISEILVEGSFDLKGSWVSEMMFKLLSMIKTLPFPISPNYTQMYVVL